MAQEKPTQEKRYYSIGEVSEMFGVSRSVIRFWEKEFASLTPHKNAKGERRFTPKNIGQLRLIHDLLRVRGFTLDGARREIKLGKERRAKREECLRKLQKIKEELERMREEL